LANFDPKKLGGFILPTLKKTLLAGTCLLAFSTWAVAQDQPAAAPPAAPAPLPTPPFTGPLSNLPPAVVDAGPLGKISVNGIVSGMGQLQNNPVSSDDTKQAALSNGSIFIQKTDGWFQYFVQAGVYNLPVLGAPFATTDSTTSALFGPVPVGYVKLQAGKNTSFLVGALPTLIGAEYIFTFQNMNVNRGQLWFQENIVNRGVQVSQTMGKVSLNFSWNDGFYSNRYSWLTGSIAYANGPHALSFVAGGNLSQTAFQNLATPVQNNSTIYNVIYTYTKGSWILTPYYQHTNVPTNAKIGVTKGASTDGFAVLASHSFGKGFALPVRFEYLTSSGSAKDGSVNLLYGPGSKATTFTVTPTWQSGGLFIRGDVGVIHIADATPGATFGPAGKDGTQFRVMGEIGFIFGDNIKKP
jgi:Putative beta-barrel porin-2, OmpL-like. bbp2